MANDIKIVDTKTQVTPTPPPTSQTPSIKPITLEVRTDIHEGLNNMAKGSSLTRSQIADIALAYFLKNVDAKIMQWGLVRVAENQAIEIGNMFK